MTAALGDPEWVCAALASILDGLSVTVGALGTVTVHGINPPPPKLDSADLPAAYVLTGLATDDTDSAGDDLDRETRTYAVQVAVIAGGQGTPDERETRCRPVLIAVKNKLRAYTRLGVAGIENARVINDTGIIPLPEYDGNLIGFEVRLMVTTLIARTYATNE